MADEDTAVDTLGSVETPIEKIVEMQSAPKTSEIQPLTGDGVPEEFRGRTMGDVMREVSTLQNSLKLSNEMVKRLAGEPQKVIVETRAPEPAPVAPQQQLLTDEQLEELGKEQGVGAVVRYLQSVNNVVLAQALERRLQPLANSAMSSAEQNARAKYPLEFEIFEQEIASLRQRVPAEVFTNPQAWDEVIKQARGNDPVKYVTELQKRQGITTTDARASQAASAGFEPPTRGVVSPSGSGSASKLDALQQKIAEEWGFSDAGEYIKFSKMGDVL